MGPGGRTETPKKQALMLHPKNQAKGEDEHPKAENSKDLSHANDILSVCLGHHWTSTKAQLSFLKTPAQHNSFLASA